ncbi:hypothetical protein CC1G_13959 [Coprinopsis cinerea okayama7|uniref:Uncharacterized protein n=1 Tax=Coprinopsis cinerea (strain Okayama-7 / 130 / ATCC MYA-4618 / FGSC 9003) TaxID=240176 RepID=D6RKH4_COPC7|nr:hypothetical protein CC1G_13959 [Coprinopsis cinerea okayama7\|eukprot:XP_002911919.1 hypothetical protein CC1G_13959 [Coprinopsis cinerea okayama7\
MDDDEKERRNLLRRLLQRHLKETAKRRAKFRDKYFEWNNRERVSDALLDDLQNDPTSPFWHDPSHVVLALDTRNATDVNESMNTEPQAQARHERVRLVKVIRGKRGRGVDDTACALQEQHDHELGVDDFGLAKRAE